MHYLGNHSHVQLHLSELSISNKDLWVQKIDFSEMLEIARGHIVDSRDAIHVWCPLGSFSPRNNRAIIKATGAEASRLQERTFPRDGLFGCFSPRKEYFICLTNPQRLPEPIPVHAINKTLPVKLEVTNACGMTYAEILSSRKKAVVNEKYFPRLRELGFECKQAIEPFRGQTSGW